MTNFSIIEKTFWKLNIKLNSNSNTENDFVCFLTIELCKNSEKSVEFPLTNQLLDTKHVLADQLYESKAQFSSELNV